MILLKELNENILGFVPKEKYYVTEDEDIYNATKDMFYKHDVANTGGYHRVTIERHKFLVHRLVAIAFIPNPQNKPEINHVDCNVNNNNVNNLEWVDRKENNNHTPTYQKRIHNIKRGQDNNFSKLTEDNVYNIVQMLEEGYSNKEIASKFNVCIKSIRNIKNGKTWKHITKYA